MAKRGGLGFEDPNANQENDFWEDKTEFTPKQTQSNQVQYQYQYPPSSQHSRNHHRHDNNPNPSHSRNPHYQQQNNHYNNYNNNNNNNYQRQQKFQQQQQPKEIYRQPAYHPSQEALDNPYSAEDEEYVDTPLMSPVPPPKFSGNRGRPRDQNFGDRGGHNPHHGGRDHRERGGEHERDRERGGDWDRENRGWNRGQKREGEWEEERPAKFPNSEYNPSTSTSTSSSSSSFPSYSPPRDDYPPLNGNEQSSASDFAKKYMEKIGWREGKGLGKTEQGIVEPIAASDKIDKRGLGYTGQANANFVPQTHHIDIEEFFPHDQVPEWIQFRGFYESGFDWSKGMKIEPIDVEPDIGQFCDGALVEQLFRTKSRLDGLDERTFFNARKLANPYEMIGKGIFQNRAAMKMANLDQMFQLTFADPDNPDPNRVDHINFADVCAGPGGFTEYVMWRKEGGGKRLPNSGAHGWGFTLAGKDDWKLEKFSHDAPTDNFKVDYGVDGKGDVLNSENIRHFAKLIEKSTGGKMLNMMMADGGVSVEGDENNQETKLKQLVMCQFLMMFNIVGKGGKFVCKLFDCFTPFTVGLLYLLYRHFEKVCVIKPHTSRPANSERYVVCFNKLEARPAVTDYLFEVNGILNNSEKGVTVTQVVDPKDMDEEFVDYITKSNTDLVQVQITALERLFKYVEDSGLISVQQGEIKKRCMEHWDVPLYRAPREGPSFHPRRVQQPVSYSSTPVEMKSIKQQEADLLNKHKQKNVYSSDWRRNKPQEEKPKGELRESQDGVGLLEGFLKHTPTPRQTLPAAPDMAQYKQKLLAEMAKNNSNPNPAPSSSASSSSSSSAPPATRKRAASRADAPALAAHSTQEHHAHPAPRVRAHVSSAHASAHSTHAHPASSSSSASSTHHAPPPSSASSSHHALPPPASGSADYMSAAKRRRMKTTEEPVKEEQPAFNLKDPKILAALQKHKAPAKH